MRWFLMTMILCLLPAAATAATVDIFEAVRQAVTARPAVVAAQEMASSAEAAASAARSRYQPRLILSESLTWTDEPAGSLFIDLNQEGLELSDNADKYNFPPSRKDFETRLTLEQPLFDADIAFSARRAGKEAEAARASAGWSREEAAFAALRAYLEVQRAQATVVWAQSARRESEETERLAAERQSAGVGLKSDRLRALAELAEAERRLNAARNDQLLAQRSLALAMGSTDAGVEIAAPLSASLFGADHPSAPPLRPDLQALTLESEAATLAWRQTRAAWLPKAALSAAYALHDASTPFGTDAGAWLLRAGLDWELFDGGRRAHDRARAAAEQRAADARRREAANRADYSLAEAELRAEEARLALESSNRALAAATEAQRLLQQRFQAGLAELSELLAAQAILDRTRAAAVDAEARLLLALAGIRLQRGTLLATLLGTGGGDQ